MALFPMSRRDIIDAFCVVSTRQMNDFIQFIRRINSAVTNMSSLQDGKNCSTLVNYTEGVLRLCILAIIKLIKVITKKGIKYRLKTFIESINISFIKPCKSPE
jgi:hypothetical protein